MGWMESKYMERNSGYDPITMHPCKINQGELTIKVIVVHGKNQKAEHELLWEALGEIKQLVGDEPWIAMGDYVEIRFQ